MLQPRAGHRSRTSTTIGMSAVASCEDACCEDVGCEGVSSLEALVAHAVASWRTNVLLPRAAPPMTRVHAAQRFARSGSPRLA